LSNPAYVEPPLGDLEAFKAGLRLGPVAVAFGVADEFYSYSSGVYNGGCSSGVNHGMTAVGYGTDTADN